jgi:hypothetical protein
MFNKIFLAIALGFLVGLTPASADPAAGSSGRVKGRIIAARVQGHVEAISKADGQKRTLHDGDRLSEQTEIVTYAGASIILVFSNGATVNIAADSTLDIEQFDQDPFAEDLKVSQMKNELGTSTTRLNLTKGELVGKVVHLNVDRGSAFTVQTPVGAAGIRGTTFLIVYRPGPNGTAFFSVATADGIVVFTGTTAQAIAIPSGKQIQVTFDINSGSPTAPIVLTDISPEVAALIEAMSQAIEAAIEDTIFGPSGNNAPNGGGKGNGIGASPGDLPSLPVVPAPATTPGAGRP